jgi:hypothetical protein
MATWKQVDPNTFEQTLERTQLSGDKVQFIRRLTISQDGKRLTEIVDQTGALAAVGKRTTIVYERVSGDGQSLVGHSEDG